MNQSKRRYFFISFLIFATVASVLLTIRVTDKETPIIDQWSSPLVAELDSSMIFFIFRWLTELGSGTFLTPFSVVFAIFIWRFSKDWVAALMCPLGALVGYRLNHWIKVLVERERPRILEGAEGVGYSFPSGHAMVSMIAYGLFIYFLIKYTKSGSVSLWINIVGVMLILLIGMSRYVIRVHYLTDVLAGYAFGFLFLMLWIGLYHLLIKLKHRFFYYESPSRD
ncbi:phosphatase PAP2 family protein [Aquibacillus halophilus]|uniref:Phosphatase PAP2 family protein n=1 Tax=Aquibacillus halophilus TaxID=930132 RepID=A0A6A8DFY5_9BACI|nr:phosphatase PAP2 family protein [Aquibacillus halophilus]MRH44140.1 phosphatase PAP2 family protein [Aquibacillus halophilus]